MGNSDAENRRTDNATAKEKGTEPKQWFTKCQYYTEDHRLSPTKT